MKNENEKIPTQIPPFQYSYSEMHHQEDEIDLYELWKTLWQGRWKVFFISITIFLVAFGYTLSVNPSYQAQVFFLPPSAEDIRELIILDHPAKKEPTGSPEEIYQTFQKNLQPILLFHLPFTTGGFRKESSAFSQAEAYIALLN